MYDFEFMKFFKLIFIITFFPLWLFYKFPAICLALLILFFAGGIIYVHKVNESTYDSYLEESQRWSHQEPSYNRDLPPGVVRWLIPR